MGVAGVGAAHEGKGVGKIRSRSSWCGSNRISKISRRWRGSRVSRESRESRSSSTKSMSVRKRKE